MINTQRNLKGKIIKILNKTTMLTLIAMVVGAILGILFGKSMTKFNFIGTIWLNCIKMVVAPLILCIMVTAIAKQKDARSLGRISGRIILYYIATTFIACIIGLLVAMLLKPGQGIVLDGLVTTEISGTTDITVDSFLTGLFSDNMFASLSSGNIMQIMVIAIFFGFAILAMRTGANKELMINFFDSCNDMIFKYIGFVMKLAPIGVLFLMANTFGMYGINIIGSMAQLIGTYWIALIIHVLLTYGLCVLIFAKINPFKFLRESSPVWSFTIASCSSAATIPVSIETAKKKFNVPERIANFCIPLGAQMNTDGTAIMFTAVLIFIGQLYGIEFSVGTLIKMVLVGALLSSCGGGIPGGGVVKLLILIEAFGLPIEIVGIVAGFYRLLDMGTTTCNCLGDLAGTICVSKLEERRARRLGLPQEEIVENVE